MKSADSRRHGEGSSVSLPRRVGGVERGDGAPGDVLRVLVAIAEAYPFAKVGGLGDIGGALPAALADRGLDVRLVLPSYPTLGPGTPVSSFPVAMGTSTEQVHVRHHGSHRGVEVFSAGNERFSRSRPYGYEDDDVAPFVLWSKAVARMAADRSWRPDIVHAHDWHAALVPQLCRRGQLARVLSPTATVLTIHNLAYQGRLSPTTRAMVGLRGAGSILARGLASADLLSTVSRRYRNEILTPAGGFGLDRLLRSRSPHLHGIVNGVDYGEFDPVRDPHLPVRYDGSFVVGKRLNKVALQRRSGLREDPGRPLLGMVSRLVHQKGISLLTEAMDGLVAAGAQVVVVGSGDEQHERDLAAAAARHPGAVAYHGTTGESLARLVYAGADMLLVPSVYEPCGLTPLIAMRYGTVPVVRRTGGMAETVIDCRQHPDTGTGLVFDGLSSAALLETVQAGLGIRRDVARWEALQRRAMRSDFSWRSPAQQYEQLYREAQSHRPAPGRRLPDGTGPRPAAPVSAPVPVVLVHHANQYLITDGYPNREGLSELLDRYTAVLRLHERYGIAASLHLSGTLLQAALWHRPGFLAMVRSLHRDGLVDIVGGTYAENVMPLFSAAFNRRQLETALWLYERHLGCDPADVRVAWVPERVWDTALLAPVLTDPTLPNGGYRAVLLDDRILRSPAERAFLDESLTRDIAALGSPTTRRAAHWADDCRPRRLAAGGGLVALPISTELRYWTPPEFPGHWSSLAEHVATLRPAVASGAVMVCADDMEKSAGVGPWEGRDVRNYEEFLRWLRSHRDVQVVGLAQWLRGSRTPPEEVTVAPGAFFELAVDWRAGEDYRGWVDSPLWATGRSRYDAATREVERVAAGPADERLLALARDHLLASAYETAWHEPVGGSVRPAPWAQAVASHARASIVIADAARWFAGTDRGCAAEVVDVDGDGETELVLRNARLYAVLTPEHGGRLVYLFCRGTRGGALVVGNPTDDWNWQRELNRYMDHPPNHPGALADVGAEHARYEVTRATTGAEAEVVMTCTAGPPWLLGARKSLRLQPGSGALAVTYELPGASAALDVQACLSPDYRRLLRHGRDGLASVGTGRRRGVRNQDVAVWLQLADGEPTRWVEPDRPPAAHGVLLQLRAEGQRFSLLLGTDS